MASVSLVGRFVVSGVLAGLSGASAVSGLADSVSPVMGTGHGDGVRDFMGTEFVNVAQDAFSAVFRKSPMTRAKLRGLQRNAAVVLENAARGPSSGNRS